MQTDRNTNEIWEAVKKRYAEVSRTAEGHFNYPTGREGAELLDYATADVSKAPPEMLRPYCGVGNPFTLGTIGPTNWVLDIGCGAGFDLLVAGRLVKQGGRVCGIDLTPEMVDCARRNLALAGITNTEVGLGAAEAIPYKSATFDIVISNGVLNLSPRKEESFREIHRVLRANGCLQCADIALKTDLPEELASSVDAWSQ